MKINRFLLVSSMMILLSFSMLFASELDTSGELSPTPTTAETPVPTEVTTPEPTTTITTTPEVTPTTIPTEVTTPTPTPTPEEKILSSVANHSSVETKKNTPVTITLDATIASGETVSYAITLQPTHGSVVQSGDNPATHIYTPENDYVGTDTFAFRLESGEYFSNVATVTITITADTANVIPFNYIDMQDHWANFSASHLAARGFIIGEEIGSRYYYHPNKGLTRGEFMLFLLAITESNTDSKVSGDVQFADSTDYPTWMLEAAKLAYAKGIITGSKEGEKIYLKLNNPISRMEAVSMISNVLDDKSSTGTITYKDVASIPNWGLNAVKNLTAYKIIQGDNVGTFRPADLLTRGEAAELCYKLLKQLETNQLNEGSGDLK